MDPFQKVPKSGCFERVSDTIDTWYSSPVRRGDYLFNMAKQKSWDHKRQCDSWLTWFYTLEEVWGNEVEWTSETAIKMAESLAVGRECHKAVCWPYCSRPNTNNLRQLWTLSKGILNFYTRRCKHAGFWEEARDDSLTMQATPVLTWHWRDSHWGTDRNTQ